MMSGISRIPVLACHTTKRICSALLLNYTQTRNTWTMERYYPLPLAKLGKERRLRKKDFIYKPTYGLQNKIPDMTVILTEYVEGIGDAGDIVTVKAFIARHELLLPRLAVYYTPENVQKYCNIQLDRPKRTAFCMKTLAELESQTLFIPLSSKENVELNSNHVRIALRLVGVELTDECIELPEELITSEYKEPFTIKILINKVFTGHVPAKIHPYHLDAAGKPVLFPSQQSETTLR